MTIIQQPSAYNLSSMMSDFIISSTVDIVFEVRLSGNTILKEVYSPDTDNIIYVRGYALGKTLCKYLSGTDLVIGAQNNIAKDFSVYIDNALQATYKVLYCNLYTSLLATEYFDGNVFLNLLTQIKWTTPDAKEYLTCMTKGQSIQVSVTYKNGNTFVDSALRSFGLTNNNQFTTVDTSFSTVASKFSTINKDMIVAYRIYIKNQIQVYYVDRDNYLLPLQFIYKNGYDVPDSIMTRGIATVKGATTYDSSLIQGISRKLNVKRNDTFTVSSGKIFSSEEYEQYKDMFNSKDVRIMFKGAYRKIIITEESTNYALRKGSLLPVSFSFQFADERENNILLGSSFVRWILEQGTWNDTNVWLDNGPWLDTP